MAFPPPARIVVRGGGEMGSGTAWRLFHAGYHAIITETDAPTAIRRWVCFSEAVYEGRKEVEGVTAVRCADAAKTDIALRDGFIPVVAAPELSQILPYRPDVIVDAILAKRGATTPRGSAARVIGLGPGFVAGGDVDCVVETNRGANLGRCIWQGSAEPNSGVPGLLGGETRKRVLRAPCDGTIEPLYEIGQTVRVGDIIARIGATPVISQLDGIVRGMMREGTNVTAGTKIGDVDPRTDIAICRRISDKSLAIAGGALEALLSDPLRTKQE